MYALTAKSMKYVDNFTIGKGIPGAVLMENAARGVVDEVLSRFSERNEKVLVLAGRGNNGGDALCVARWLLHYGYDVTTYFIGDSTKVSNDFIVQARALTEMHPKYFIAGLTRSKRDIMLLKKDYDIIIDGIYGIGLNRRFGSNFSRFIEYMNAKDAYKIAIDIPSGLNATTGQSMDAVLRADLTVTFSHYKIGMFLGDGRESCGEIVVKDIGLDETCLENVRDKLYVCDTDFYERTRGNALLPRKADSHKGTYGTVGIIVGPNSMLGASMLAAKSAYRAGCGLVRIFCPAKYTGFFNVSIPEAVAVPYRSDDVTQSMDEFLPTVDVVLIGPGLQEDSTGKLLVKQILAGKTRAVLDAGALNIISKNLKPFRRRNCDCVITPHVGEMARLCNDEIPVIAKNIIGFTERFSEKYNVSMVVKNDVSVISLVDGEGGQMMYLNTLGNSGLATAGSGDVLAGVIASFIAQGNGLGASLLYGVMTHGNAADRICNTEDDRRRMMAGDLIDNLF